jgi:hypothetical protein
MYKVQLVAEIIKKCFDTIDMWGLIIVIFDQRNFCTVSAAGAKMHLEPKLYAKKNRET